MTTNSFVVKWLNGSPRKASKRYKGCAVRTKTDTGRRGEYPKALERIHVKELGKFDP